MPDSPETTPDLESIKAKLREFAAARDWDQFHSPKNLVMALVSEVGELVEHFQWLSEQDSRKLPEDRRAAVREELADIQIYLIMLGEKLEIDLMSAAGDKIKKNEENYPPEKARGTSKKYTDI